MSPSEEKSPAAAIRKARGGFLLSRHHTALFDLILPSNSLCIVFCGDICSSLNCGNIYAGSGCAENFQKNFIVLKARIKC